MHLVLHQELLPYFFPWLYWPNFYATRRKNGQTLQVTSTNPGSLPEANLMTRNNFSTETMIQQEFIFEQSLKGGQVHVELVEAGDSH